MNNFIFKFLFFLGLLAATACEEPRQQADLSWPEVQQSTKPWTRWWWHGSSVTREGITAELEAYQKAGIGGVELTPIYGIRGGEQEFVSFLSEEWVDMLLFTLQEADRLGLGVDMATGTGWPFGGPWVDADIACKNMVYRKFSLNGGQALSEKVEYLQEPLLRTVQPTNLKISDLKQPIAANTNLQELALDQVRFEKPLPLQTLMAYSEAGEKIELTEKVNEKGQLDWIAPDGKWTLFAVFQGWHGKMVERAAPGGEGNVIDHFSSQAIEQYLAAFDQAFKGKNISSLRAFFNDSYEVDDARGQADWTPALLDAFEEKRGYDLRNQLPALFGEDEEKKNQRVLSDYRETIGDLLFETFTQGWSAWAKKNQAIIRNQAHGSPANILDLYGASDIPETEGTDIIKIKMASSAAHVNGKPLASAEAATWLGEHFTTNLADLKENVDRYLAGGINHVFYHGTSYSPPGEPWPGRLFYAAIHANPRNSLWQDYPALNRYIGRTQAFLQMGNADNDILLYFPAYDRFGEKGQEMLAHFHGEAAPRGGTSRVREAAERLQEQGYAFDFVSDKQILEMGNSPSPYKAVLVPETHFMPLSTLQKLQDLSAKGMKVIFQKMPASVPGFHDWESRQQTFEQLIANFQKEEIIVQNDLANALESAGISREWLVDKGLEFHRRSDGESTLYFISNWSEDNFDGWIRLATPAKSVAIFDPMTALAGFAETRLQDGQLEMKLQLNRGASCILKTFPSTASGEKWHYLEQGNQSLTLEGPWELSFNAGGPELPPTQEMETVTLWTELPDERFHHFSGTATYSTEFALPEGEGSGWLLNLGKVAESATVSINGSKAGTVLGPAYQLFIPSDMLDAKNRLEIAVSNSMTNRIRFLEQSGQRWQRFYNINISARLRENLGKDRVFTTLNWTVHPSGLAGPVTLTSIQ